MFDINGGEFLVILLIAVIVIGPTRLPHYAEQLGRLTRQARRYLTEARERVGEELGEDVQDIDWEALDPRRYDPRRIVRDALRDADPATAAPRAGTVGPAVSASTCRTSATVGAAAASTTPADVPAPPAPYDDEAT